MLLCSRATLLTPKLNGSPYSLILFVLPFTDPAADFSGKLRAFSGLMIRKR